MRKKASSIIVIFGLVIVTIIGLALFFFPYFFIPDTVSVTQVPWSETGFETPKAVIQFTFTSKIAFTTNFPIRAKVDIWLYRQDQNDTHMFVHIVNPPAKAFTYPLGNPPADGLIYMSQTGDHKEGELQLEFTSAGAYGFAIYSGETSYLGNMTVGYAAQDTEVIQISPPETRFTTEWIIRGLGFSIMPISYILGYIKVKGNDEEEPKLIIEKVYVQNFIFAESNEQRRFIIATVRNTGKVTAKRCTGYFESTQTPESSYKLHWSDTLYQRFRDKTEPIDIGPTETRDLDIAFSLGGLGTEVNADTATSAPMYLTGSNINPKGTFDPSAYQIDYPEDNPPKGSWIAIPMALTDAPNVPQAFLRPGRYEGLIRIETEKLNQGDKKEITIVSAASWQELTFII